MKIVTYHDNRVAAIREEISYEANGNVLLGDGTGIAAILVKGVYEVEEIPEEVKEEKYCYTEETGFYLNENWKESVDINSQEERISALEDAVNVLLGF